VRQVNVFFYTFLFYQRFPTFCAYMCNMLG
jgi:hypothetical protein